MEKIRILQIVTKMNKGGLENRLIEIYRNLDKDKYQFDFFTFSKSKGFFDDEIRSLGGKIFYNERILRNIFKAKKNLKDFLRTNNYKIIHSHLNQWNKIILKTAKDVGVENRISHSRTSLEKISVKNIIKKNVTKYSTLNLAVSQKAGEWLYGNKKFIVIPNAIDIDKFAFSKKDSNDIREKFNLKNEKIYIHVGNIKPEKNHKYLIKVFKRILSTDENSKLMLIGNDYMKGKIFKYIKKMGLEDFIIVTGSVNDVQRYLSAADVFLFPSIYEGFPGSVLEALSNGLPCIISTTISSEFSKISNIYRIDIKNKNLSEWANQAVKLRRYTNDIKADLKRDYDIKKITHIYEKLYYELFYKGEIYDI